LLIQEHSKTRKLALILAMMVAVSANAQSNKAESIGSSQNGGKDFPPELRKGLLIYWGFNNDGIVADLSGNNHTGKVSNAMWIKDGAIGGAYEFKGNGTISAERLQQPDTGEISVSAWIRPSFDFKQGIKRQQITSHSWGSHQFQYDGGSLRVELYAPSHQFHHFNFPSTFQSGKWYHVAFTAKAGRKVTTYVDGNPVLEANMDFKLEPANKEFRIGNSCGNDRAFFFGAIDEIMIWDRELPPGHIKNIYKMRNDKNSPKE